jgi:hypothetical protein
VVFGTDWNQQGAQEKGDRAVARKLFIDIWRIRTGRITAQEVGLVLSD